MNEYQLTIPKDVVEKAQVVAHGVGLPLDDLLLEPIHREFDTENALPPDEERELWALQWLSDEVLWGIALERMPAKMDKELEDLINRNKRGELSAEGVVRIDEVLEYGDRLMVRKGTAASLLTKRGYDIKSVISD